MLKPSVSNSFLDTMKLVRDDITCVWNDIIERFQILHKDKRTGLERIVYTVQDDEGNYRDPDQRTILHLANVVAWECLDAYPDPKDLFDIMSVRGRTKQETIRKRKAARKDYLKWFNKEHKKEWRAALENARKGIYRIPKDETPKIYVGGKL